MDLTPFKCFVCKCLPEEDVFICSSKHIICIQCAEKASKVCKCSCDLKITQNPLECALLNINTNCIFKPNGCTWSFPVKELHQHLGECKYRPYICVGKTLNVSECSWEGFKYQVVDHFKASHSSRKMYSYTEEDKIPLFSENDNNISTAINLVDAFNKTFVFFYESNRDTNTVSMIIYLLGRKKDAKKYMYEIEIWNEFDKAEKIKFLQACYSDTDDIPDLIKSGKCLSISQTLLKNYVRENEIYFRFRMHNRNASSTSKSKSCTNLNVATNNTNKYTKVQSTNRNQQPRRQEVQQQIGHYRMYNPLNFQSNMFYNMPRFPAAYGSHLLQAPLRHQQKK